MATHSPVRYAIFPTWQLQDSGEDSQGENCKTSLMSRLWNWTTPFLPHIVQSKSQGQTRINRVENRLHPLMGITAKNLWPYLIYHRVKEKFWGEFCNVVSLWYEALHGKHWTQLRNVTEKSHEPKQTFSCSRTGEVQKVFRTCLLKSVCLGWASENWIFDYLGHKKNGSFICSNLTHAEKNLI